MTEAPEKERQLKVLLFKATKDGEEDPYEQILLENQFIPYSIAVLEFEFVNLSALQDCLCRCGEFSGIVFTSQRAVEATSQAIRDLKDDGEGKEKKRRRCLDLPCCVVGGSTHKSAEAAGFSPLNIEAGNADRLADHIIENLGSWKERPVLYPCGNLRRDTLSTKLKENGFTLNEIEVYQTVKNSQIAEILQEMKAFQGDPDVVVYFSPSGVKYTSEFLTNGMLTPDNIKFVSIGPTTEKELQGRGVAVHATAETPDARGVLHAVIKIRDQRQP